ncbi:MAG: hypothetical protein R3C97_07530 [Geminicoccaceae bacterium]
MSCLRELRRGDIDRAMADAARSSSGAEVDTSRRTCLCRARGRLVPGVGERIEIVA